MANPVLDRLVAANSGSRPGSSQQQQLSQEQAAALLAARPASRQFTPLRTSHSSRPGSRQGTAAPGSRGGSRCGSAGNAPMSILAGKLIQKMRTAFGSAADDLQGQEIITQEVLGVLNSRAKGATFREEDVYAIQNRIRSRLIGGTPVKHTFADNKRAMHQGDEWAKVYQYNIAEGKVMEGALALEEKERQRKLRELLDQQKRELAERKQQEARDEQTYAEQEQAEYRAWQKQEEERQRLQQQIVEKLKQERVDQLADKNKRRQRALAAVRADEDDMAARLAYQAKTELEKEEIARIQAKNDLKAFLLQNEANKLIKQQAKEAQWEEDAYYQKEWQKVLEKQEKERTDRLNKNLARQNATAAYAASGKLGEYKRWIDPAIIERHFKERETALDRDEEMRKTKQLNARKDMKQRLNEQVLEQEQLKREERGQNEMLGRQVLARAAAEEAREQAKKAAREAAKGKLSEDIKNQMKDNVAIKRFQPITSTERSINKDLLDRVHEWKLTGSVDLGNSLNRPRQFRTSVKI